MPADDHYAIVVGIDAYAGFQPLTAARADAARFTEWLLDPDGGQLPEANVHSIRVRPPGNRPFDARPILQDILEALIAMNVAEYRRVGQRLYFYFSGHGVGPQFNDVAMLFATAYDGLFTNLSLVEMMRFFDEAAVFDEVVIILDCCREQRAAQPTGLGFVPPNAPDRPPTTQFVLLGAPHRGVAYEDHFDDQGGARRGLLTKAVLEGLAGAPQAINTQGQVTSSSLAVFVGQRVAELSQQTGVEQSAEALPPNTDIIFRTRSTPATTFKLTIDRWGEATTKSFSVIGPGPVVLHREPAGVAPVVIDLAFNASYLVILDGGRIATVTDSHVVAGAANVVFD